MRRKHPKLVSEVVDVYKIVRELLKLEDFELNDLEKKDPRKMGPQIRFCVQDQEEEVKKKFEDYQNRDRMKKVFFPFVEPNLLFTAENGEAEIFLNFDNAGGHAEIVGYCSKNDDFHNVLMWFCEAASQAGIRYIELLVSAFRPDLQRVALDSKFLPCAYYPIMRLNDQGEREDHLLFSRSFETLDFIDMHLVATNRRFLDAFMKSWYEMLVRCQPSFDDEDWRIG